MIKTAITEMFGIQYPILCGAMMWLSKPELCAAISNAGGMGNVTAANYDTENDFREAIKRTRKLTDKPFMVGVTILPSVRITTDHYKMYLKVCAEEKIAGVEVSGAPVDKACGPEYIDMLKKAGVKLFHKVGSVRHAVHAEHAGYDGIYAAGIEEGGHPLNDDVTSMVLIPRICEEVRIPVVAVGGMVNGKTMAAAMMLGAQGIMMATRFMATQECSAHNDIKTELCRRRENDTALICKTIHLQARALRNKNVDAVLAVEARGGGFEEILPLITGDRIAKAWETGDVDMAPMMVGQSVGLVHDIPTVRELLERMAREAADRVKAVSKNLGV